jgi:hypothetical protein
MRSAPREDGTSARESSVLRIRSFAGGLQPGGRRRRPGQANGGAYEAGGRRRRPGQASGGACEAGLEVSS